MADDPTEAVIKREIARARQIIREDLMLAKLTKAFPDEPPKDPDQPPPPPPKDPADPPKRRGVWWGEALDK
jgi:hypothetical protein